MPKDKLKKQRDALRRYKHYRRHEKAVDYIDKRIKLWMGRLWLLDRKVDAVFEWNGFGDHPDCSVAAEIVCQWEYKQAKIRFNVPALAEMQRDQIDRTIVHELCHLIVNPMHDGKSKLEEMVVTHMTDTIMWAYAHKR
jgi:hypothetical protein